MNLCNDPDHGAINAERAESRGLRKAWVDLDDKRQILERERNEARELLREIRDDEVNAQDECDKFLRDHVPSELSKVTEQRDRLAEALQNIRSGYGGQITDPDCGCDDCVYLRPIDAALQSLNQTNE